MAGLDDSGQVARTAASREFRWCYTILFPIWVLTLWLAGIPVDHVWRTGTVLLLAASAAAVVSIMAGIRIGASFADAARPRMPGITLLPVAVAWLALALPAQAAFVTLAVVVAAQGAWDSIGTHRGELPEAYGGVRRWQTLWLFLAMLVGFVASS